MSRPAHFARAALSAAALALSALSTQAAVVPDCSSGTCLVELSNVTITFVGTSSWVDEPALEIIQDGTTVGFWFDPDGHYELHSDVPVPIDNNNYQLHYLPAVRFDAKAGYQFESLDAQLQIVEQTTGGGISSSGTTLDGQYSVNGVVYSETRRTNNELEEIVYGFAGGISNGMPPYPTQTWGSVVIDATRYTVTAQIAAVPEPATLGLFAMGALGLVAAGRRARKAG